MTTMDLLNNPAILLGGIVGVKMANQAIDEFLDRLTGKRNKYVTQEQCAICKIQTDHKFNEVLRELSETRKELNSVRQLLLDIIDRTGTPLTGHDVGNLSSSMNTPL